MRTLASYARMTTATEAVLAARPDRRGAPDPRRGARASATASRRTTRAQARRRASRRRSSGTRWPRRATWASTCPRSGAAAGSACAGLAAVGEEIAAAGKSLLLIVVSPAIVGSILARHGTDAQKERWLRGIAAGTTKVAFAITEPDAGTNSHNLATSLERRGDRLRAQRPEDLHLGRRARRRRAGRGPQPAARRHSSGCPRSRIVDVDAPGFTRDEIPMPYLGPDKQWTLFFDDVELEEERLIGGEGGGLGPSSTGSTPSASWAPSIALRRRAAARSTRRPPTRTSAPSGARRSAPTRASRTRWPRPRSSSSWRG